MIETERLMLTEPTIADYEASYAMNSDAVVARLTGGKPASREDAWNKLLRNIGHWASYGYGIFVVREKAGGAFVGEVGLAHFCRGFGDAFDPFPEAAWVLAPGAQGKGYATEAAAATHRWMDQRQRLQRSVCIIDPDNRASVRLAEKLGSTGFGEIDYRGARLTMFERQQRLLGQ